MMHEHFVTKHIKILYYLKNGRIVFDINFISLRKLRDSSRDDNIKLVKTKNWMDPPGVRKVVASELN